MHVKTAEQGNSTCSVHSVHSELEISSGYLLKVTLLVLNALCVTIHSVQLSKETGKYQKGILHKKSSTLTFVNVSIEIVLVDLLIIVRRKL